MLYKIGHCERGRDLVKLNLFCLFRTDWKPPWSRCTTSWQRRRSRETFAVTIGFTFAKATTATTWWTVSTRTASRRTSRSRSTARSFKGWEERSCTRKIVSTKTGEFVVEDIIVYLNKTDTGSRIQDWYGWVLVDDFVIFLNKTDTGSLVRCR